MDFFSWFARTYLSKSGVQFGIFMVLIPAPLLVVVYSHLLFTTGIPMRWLLYYYGGLIAVAFMLVSLKFVRSVVKEWTAYREAERQRVLDILSKG